jgi:FAD dependent oxidoreductase.
LVLGGLRDGGDTTNRSSSAGISGGGSDDSAAGDPATAAALRAWFAAKFPELAASSGAVFEQAWLGVLGFVSDGLPVAGPMPGTRGAVWVCGGSHPAKIH